jgi:dihydrofolate reductase
MAPKASGRPAAQGNANHRKVVAQAMVSLDGVMQAPGGPDEDRDGGFTHGGWEIPLWDEGMGDIMAKGMAEPHELLLGRKTYDIFAGYWPKQPDGPYATPLNKATKHVASRSRRKLAWENSRLLQGDAAAAVAELKRQDGPPLHVMGSSDLLQTLLKNDLVDQLDLWVFPVVLGSGKRLFGDGAIPTRWRLKESKASPTGVTFQRYERAGGIAYA